MVVEKYVDVTVQKAFQAGIDAVADTSDKALYSAAKKSRAKLYGPTVNDFMTASNEGNSLFAIVVTAQLIAQAAPSTPHPSKTSYQELGIKKGSSTARKCVEVLEIEVFGEPQEGVLKDRVSMLKSEIF
eukprot:3432567-Ditylum_brightwellii.AAC.1